MSPELIVKFVADLSGFTQGVKDVKNGAKTIGPELKKATAEGKEMSYMLGKVASIAGGAFVTAATSVALAVYNANEQVESLNKSMRISSGTLQNYTQNTATLLTVSDRYKKSVFELGSSFNELARETRGTINEGKDTADIFETIVSVSKKMGTSVENTTGSLSGFIDKMKQGTVDSTGLSNEVDKRLFDAFEKVARQMGLTNDELNKVLKTSDEAVSTILPKLAQELANSLGDIPQQDVQDLGDGFTYAWSKLTILLDALFKTSGAKSVISKAIEETGGLLDQLAILAKEKGNAGLVGGALGAGLEKLFPIYKSPALDYARSQQSTRNQTPSMGRSFALPGEIGNYANSPIQPKGGVDIQSEAEKIRAEEEAKENKKRIAEAKRLAAERKRALDEIVRQEIADSNQRVKDQIAAAMDAQAKSYTDRPGAGIGDRATIGTDKKYNYSKDQFTTEFTNQLGNSAEMMKKLVSLADSFTPIKWEAIIRSDALKKEQEKLAATAQAINDSVNEQLNAAFEQAGHDIPVAIGNMLGSMATGGEGMKNVGNAFFQIASDLFQRVGEALLTASGIFKAADVAIGSMNPAAALAGAVISFAAAGVLRSQINKSGKDASQRFFTGGIPVGPVGVDNIPVKVSGDEMILNPRQQRNLFNALNGSNNESSGAPTGLGRQGRGETLKAEVRGDKLSILVERGKRRLNRYK